MSAPPADLSDLRLPEREQLAEQAYTRTGKRQCVCQEPKLYRNDDDLEPVCFQCGHARVETVALEVARNGSSPIAADSRPAPGGVPWTLAQEIRLRELVQAGEGSSWGVGDLALELIPHGSRGHRRGVLKLIAELAKRVGFEPNSLKQSRTVAHCWPAEHRVAGATYGAHAAHLKGGRGRAHNRAVLLRRLVAERGKATADLVREARSGQSEPVAVLAIRFTSEQRRRLDALAEAEGRSRSALVRQAVDELLEAG
jgi:Ribbon-helix-helix protein, copG family